MGKQDPSTGDKKSVANTLELSPGELRELQEKDDTLTKIREAADGHANSAGVGFFNRDGLVYRRWTPPGRGEEYEIEQLVLPKACRKAVLALGHEIPLSWSSRCGEDQTAYSTSLLLANSLQRH